MLQLSKAGQLLPAFFTPAAALPHYRLLPASRTSLAPLLSLIFPPCPQLHLRVSLNPPLQDSRRRSPSGRPRSGACSSASGVEAQDTAPPRLYTSDSCWHPATVSVIASPHSPASPASPSVAASAAASPASAAPAGAAPPSLTTCRTQYPPSPPPQPLPLGRFTSRRGTMQSKRARGASLTSAGAVNLSSPAPSAPPRGEKPLAAARLNPSPPVGTLERLLTKRARKLPEAAVAHCSLGQQPVNPDDSKECSSKEATSAGPTSSPVPPPSSSPSPSPSTLEFPPLLSLLHDPSWREALETELSKPYARQLQGFLNQEAARGQVLYPSTHLVFNAFNACPLASVRVVILGQDPYIKPGEAMGLCFSVPRGVTVPPSLLNIFKELEQDLGCPRPQHGDLSTWANQGILLLNTVLTVRKGDSNSHAKKGWEALTDAAIRAVARQHLERQGAGGAGSVQGFFSKRVATEGPPPQAAAAAAADSKAKPKGRPLVFLLWGRAAESKSKLLPLDAPHLRVLVAPHPSPLASKRRFAGCRHFSQTNDFLRSYGETPIDWSLPP